MPITAFETGWLGKIEATYGTAETLSTSADGLLPYIPDDGPEAPTSPEYVFDGNIGRASGSSPLPSRRMQPAGRFASFELPVLWRGAGETYTALVTPPNEVHRGLIASGFDAAFNVDEWVYTPTPLGNGFKGMTVRRYAHGRQWNTVGTLFDLSIDAQGLGAPMVRYAARGRMAALPADASLPAIDLPQELIFPALAQAVAGDIGDFAFGGAEYLRSVNITTGRSTDNPRIAQNLAGGHGGFFAGYMNPTFTVVMERSAAVISPFHTSAGIDAEALREAATAIPLSFQFGTVSGQRYTLSTDHAQLATVTSSQEGGIALVSMEFRPHADATNELVVRFD